MRSSLSPPPNLYASPKRKRATLDTDPTISLSPPTNRLRSSPPPSSESPGGDSPRTVVASQLEDLAITTPPHPPEPHSNSNTNLKPPSDPNSEIQTPTPETAPIPVTTITTTLPIQTPSTTPTAPPPQRRPLSPPPENHGLNGIGFRPTPALAYARAQTRKRQVAEWKSREAREARQRRIERRGQGREAGSMGLVVGGGGGGGGGGGIDGMHAERRRVRFVEG